MKRSDTPLTVAATAQSLAAEAFSLQSRITDLRRSLALLNAQMQSVSDTLHRLRAVSSEDALPPPSPSSGLLPPRRGPRTS
ncbi:hypothetical protein OHA98_25835 [Streptomyces sp. NBC_00654]|uniref:hypothetical protein n=1 Tax=Streptomyces sp. NBC_00654 TaxID=2975799 RepID=UPI00224CFCC4|nr:hypothetical protein [Streptomyces sp. NBC_00654]MCX4968117.1 hypothetical protein [Streptomyces sp. NBC_00654]